MRKVMLLGSTLLLVGAAAGCGSADKNKPVEDVETGSPAAQTSANPQATTFNVTVNNGQVTSLANPNVS